MQVEIEIKSMWYLDEDDGKTLASAGRSRTGKEEDTVKEIVFNPVAGYVIALLGGDMWIIPPHRVLSVQAYKPKVSTLQ